MVSSPKDLPPLKAKAEWEKVRDALSAPIRQGLVVLDQTAGASLAALQEKLRQAPCHVFHFIGHGGFDPTADSGVLMLHDVHGKSRPISGQDLGTILHDRRDMRLVVLNSCEGARPSLIDPFAGVAQVLLRQGIPAVIAMQFEISDDAAVTFSREFYKAVADRYPADAALVEARKIIFAEGNGLEWATPVLYMRSPDGRIFDFASASLRLLARYLPSLRPWFFPRPDESGSANWLKLARQVWRIFLIGVTVALMALIFLAVRLVLRLETQILSEEEIRSENLLRRTPANVENVEASGSYIASHARFSPLRFFESNGDEFSPEDGRYSTVFDIAQARYIAWELGVRLGNAKLKQDLDFYAEAIYTYPSGESEEITSRCHVGASEDETLCIGMAGWSRPGEWRNAGIYSVAVRIGATTVATGTFTIQSARLGP
jgi:hypothetical protein